MMPPVSALNKLLGTRMAEVSGLGLALNGLPLLAESPQLGRAQNPK